MTEKNLKRVILEEDKILRSLCAYDQATNNKIVDKFVKLGIEYIVKHQDDILDPEELFYANKVMYQYSKIKEYIDYKIKR